jgi:hypothetical protein
VWARASCQKAHQTIKNEKTMIRHNCHMDSARLSSASKWIGWRSQPLHPCSAMGEIVSQIKVCELQGE